MKRLILTTAAVAFAASLAACGKEEASAPAAAPAPPASITNTTPAAGSDMSKMDMSAGAKMAKGSGTVTGVDATAGTITLDHGPIPEANWPAMTMTFKASRELAKSVKVGDKASFELKLQNGSGEITAIRRQ
ncbi:MAG: copper-binding protein [Phenylobacterium sp.]|nr:copper-binding protein [Phenylobacterium sp.]